MSRRGRWAVALVWFLPAAAVLAAGPAEKVRRGNESYLAGDLEEALARYTDAQVDVPDSPILHYNIGNVLFRQGDYERAMDEYRLAELSDDPGLRGSARFNIGNAHFLSQEFDKAVEDYAKVLRENPDDADAKRNLELALRALQQQQQQPQDRQQQDEEQEPDQQDQDPQQQDQQAQEDQQQQESQASGEQEDRRDEAQEQQQDGSQEPRPPESPADQQQAEGETPQPSDGTQAGEPTLPEEEAARILDALKQEEKENMKRALRASRTGRGTGKDW